MDNQVRIFRKNPIAWWDKNTMRYLRHKYGKDKKTFVLIRSVYLALCEIESDFNNASVNSFTQTVGTYAGTSRQVAGKYINILQRDGLISKIRLRDEKTNKFLSGTTIEILDFQAKSEQIEPLAGYPTSGVTQQRDTPTGIKNISIDKKLSINTNVNENLSIRRRGETKSLRDILIQYDLQIPRKARKEAVVQRKTSKANGGIDKNQRDYLASEIAEKLNDQKSLGAFRVIAEKVPQAVVFEVLSSIKETAREGKIKVSRGALFVNIIRGYCEARGIDLGFKDGFEKDNSNNYNQKYIEYQNKSV